MLLLFAPPNCTFLYLSDSSKDPNLLRFDWCVNTHPLPCLSWSMLFYYKNATVLNIAKILLKHHEDDFWFRRDQHTNVKKLELVKYYTSGNCKWTLNREQTVHCGFIVAHGSTMSLILNNGIKFTGEEDHHFFSFENTSYESMYTGMKFTLKLTIPNE